MKIEKKEEAFTGLEAAIVLIAFVVVAAVFSYVMLGAGFFTTQKSQEVIHAGVSQAATNLEIKGEVYGVGSGTAIDFVRFDIGLAPGGYPVDMNKTILVYSTGSTLETLTMSASTSIPQAEILRTSAKWNVSNCTFTAGYTGTNLLLEGGEIMTIWAAPTTPIGTSTTFNIEIKPSNGASFFIRRTTPDGLSNIQMLH